MKKVRIGVIGVKGMGGAHLRSLHDVKRAEIAAVCDMDREGADSAAENHKCTAFYDAGEMFKSKTIDAVIIATPHYAHTTIGIQALKAGLHVLVEKPISVHKADCEKLIAAWRGKKQVFAAMFNMRTDPCYKKIKELVSSGELGEITRANWIITNWFRTQAYYDSGGWRATWKGEGGGVLLNQCPHNLDLMQWILGMPSRVRAFCALGKYHDIEVEDEVTAYLEYPNGSTGVFVTSTGEAPGTNRLEICGDRGKLVLENGALRFARNEVGTSKFMKTTDKAFATPPIWNVDIPITGKGGHVVILSNFVDAVLDRVPLIAPAPEGINSVELGNAMLFSSMKGKPVDMPLDGRKFELLLKKLIRESRFQKKTARKRVVSELGTSFNMTR